MDNGKYYINDGTWIDHNTSYPLSCTFAVITTGGKTTAGLYRYGADGSVTDITAYTEDRALTNEDRAVFDKALEGLMGVRYEPVSVATQVTAGTNYRFTATAAPVVPNPVSYTAHIFVYKSLSGEVELTGIVRL